MPDYRASFDAAITFGNGGDLTVHGFRVDLPGPDATESEIAALFVASLGLLMADTVELADVRIFPEPHKGTRGGPSDRGRAQGAPGTTAPVELDRAVPESGPFIEAPGGDLAAVPLSRSVDLPAVVVRVAGATARAVDVGAVAAFDVRGHAVLLHTGAHDGFVLTDAAAAWLVEHGAALVGTDSDELRGAEGRTTARERLLGAGVPVVEGLGGLEGLPPTGALFAAPPPRLMGVPRAPVRAYARVPQ
ncbi:cyclase family protein [Nonomuraea aridisoli]|uniref:Cyclase n=1 Tax=Nonomuraea aridisoli TaxID=2070368 RepID=A0A2W2F6Q6_9ACTN|nr:cyclase family protein [Nonomuraea aridisoli]PZG20788.1 cyclase [Nonomuraea aridisoli]